MPKDPRYDRITELLGNRPRLIEEANALYQRILDLHLKENVKLTLNVSGILLEQLKDVVKQKIKEGLGKGIFEITSTSYYHSLLPLFPKEDNLRQIKMHEKTLIENFNYRAKGFFLPELAFDPHLVNLLKEMGYEWIIGEDEWLRLIKSNFSEEEMRRVHYVLGLGGEKIKILFRHREASLLLWKLGEDWAKKRMIQIFNAFEKKDVCLLICLDAEVWGLYGGDNLGNLKWLIDIVRMFNMDFKLISEVVSSGRIDDNGIYIPSFTWAHPEERYGLESKENCTFYNWMDNDREKILFRLIGYARDEIKRAEILSKNAEKIEEAWKYLLLSEASDWFGWQHVPFRALLGREFALKAYETAKEAIERR
ncbi:MAG: polysaccharide deacetylase family protein [Candidatus Nanoarchaeia archaeon]|nr:polysaccharide deacetylase family protein [Candidatus Jingweiarchaeum tengchongense]